VTRLRLPPEGRNPICLDHSRRSLLRDIRRSDSCFLRRGLNMKPFRALKVPSLYRLLCRQAFPELVNFPVCELSTRFRARRARFSLSLMVLPKSADPRNRECGSLGLLLNSSRRGSASSLRIIFTRTLHSRRFINRTAYSLARSLSLIQILCAYIRAVHGRECAESRAIYGRAREAARDTHVRRHFSLFR